MGNLNSMFKGAAVFNQSLNSWNAAKVTKMNLMFNGAALFAQNLNDWNVAKVADTISMFEGATLFNQDLSAWDVGTNNGANLNPVIANYGIVGGAITQFADMFKGTTMSNCNKKAIHNKFEAAPRSLSVDFDGATGDATDWSFPNLVCP